MALCGEMRGGLLHGRGLLCELFEGGKISREYAANSHPSLWLILAQFQTSSNPCCTEWQELFRRWERLLIREQKGQPIHLDGELSNRLQRMTAGNLRVMVGMIFSHGIILSDSLIDRLLKQDNGIHCLFPLKSSRHNFRFKAIIERCK